MIQLRSYELAVEIYRECKHVRLPHFLQDQLLRASSSAALNLAEGYGKKTTKDRAKFFTIAMGSIREIQAVADLEPAALNQIKDKIDHLAASVYKLTR
jgi:four helix bundle protein